MRARESGLFSQHDPGTFDSPEWNGNCILPDLSLTIWGPETVTSVELPGNDVLRQPGEVPGEPQLTALGIDMGFVKEVADRLAR